jgi:hypothetical protein
VTKRRWLIGGVVVLFVAVLGLLGAYAWRGHAVERNAHQEPLRHHVSCVQSVSGAVYATPSVVTSSYRCTSKDGVQVADVEVRQPFGLTPFRGRRLSAMVAEETR